MIYRLILRFRHSLVIIATLFVFVVTAGATIAETVVIKYRGLVDLKPFDCRDITRSSLIRRLCYDATNQYMLISLSGTYYHYCQIDPGTVSTLLNAESMGRYFNSYVKGRFDCRVFRIPNY